MTQSSCMEPAKLQLLRELFNSAIYDASTAMCRWTNSVINLTIDEVHELSLENAYKEVGDDLLTMVVMNLEGELGGSMVFSFSEEDGRKLAASLLQTETNPGPEWNEMEQSALAETGNIIGCAYVNALTRLIDRSLSPSIPYFLQDYGTSVVQQALVAQASARDSVLICRTCFRQESEKLNWWMLFVPSEELHVAMEDAIHWPA